MTRDNSTAGAELLATVRDLLKRLDASVRSVEADLREVTRIAASDETRDQRLARLIAMLPASSRAELAVLYDLPEAHVQ